MKSTLLLVLWPILAGAITAAASAAPSRDPRPYAAPAALPDVLQLANPADVQLSGYLGTRVVNNEKNRLLAVAEEPLLAGFRHKPGEQAWIGEHVGKWLHAATLAWANTGDPALREKLDRVATELIKTQEPDGYLGTYTKDKRFGLYPNADWDVWVHKYDLMGLLTYYQYTGNEPALRACRKVGDLLIDTFGPGKKSILSAGTHVGMAATSVLEPTVLLYRTTGDRRYLDFAKYLVGAWDEPNGPKVLSTLTNVKSVSKTANGKAYEMLSNLVGLCELARATGDRKYLQAVINAWEDVTAHQLYITGTASYGEHFHADYDLPNQPGANVGETCVTVTWIQLNSQLLRLTGEARYADELERSYYNHLAGAQRPDGAEWCYYTPLEGTKPYGPGINCCVSSGPRAMALLPQLAYLKYRAGGHDGAAVDFFESSSAELELAGTRVRILQTAGPMIGEPIASNGAAALAGLVTLRTTLMVRPSRSATFEIKVRAPRWASDMRADLGNHSDVLRPTGGWLTIPARKWGDGDRIELTYVASAGAVRGDHKNAGRTAMTWGPLILALDEGRNPGLGPVRSIAYVPASRPAGGPAEFTITVSHGSHVTPATLVPFAEAGRDGRRFQVWLWDNPPASGGSVFESAREARSRAGNQGGSITDGDPGTFVVTFDATQKDEDWFAVAAQEPLTFKRIVFCHGHSFHDGGWFDASGGKPQVQVKREKGGKWEAIGTLDDYPATTATDPKGLQDGQAFALRLPQPLKAVAIRVVGKPSTGDNPQQAFSSCGELQAFAD